MKIRRASSRGKAKADWIESRRMFSNNSYWDPNYMRWESIEVVNDDILQPGHMVPRHQHKHLDILGYLIDGTLEHEDSLGNKLMTSSGDVQHMKCGDSIFHTEKCVSETPARYIQIWVSPGEETPGTKYELVRRPAGFGKLEVVIDRKNIEIYCGERKDTGVLDIKTKALLYVISGTVHIANDILSKGDSAELESEYVHADFDAHIILFQILPVEVE